MRRTRSITIFASLLALSAIAAPSAIARNGGAERESKPVVTAPAEIVVRTCDDPIITSLPDPDTLLINPLSFDAGCLAVRVVGTSYRVAAVALTTGWTYQVQSSADGTRVRIEFSNASTGQKFDARVEAGRTVIG